MNASRGTKLRAVDIVAEWIFWATSLEKNLIFWSVYPVPAQLVLLIGLLKVTGPADFEDQEIAP